jgi:propanediol dehydratase large subunit
MARIELLELTKIVHLQAIAAREATRCITAALAETGSPELRDSLHRKFLLAAGSLDQASPVIGEHLRELADLVECIGTCLDDTKAPLIELPV